MIRERIKIPSTHKTIVAPDGREKWKESVMPRITLKRAIDKEIMTLFKNPTLNCSALMVGMTISAPISKLPTTLIESAIIIATTLTSKKFKNLTFMPLTFATSSS